MTILPNNYKTQLFGIELSLSVRPAKRKPHHHDMRNAHREHLLAVDRQKMKLAERGTMARLRAWAWEAFE